VTTVANSMRILHVINSLRYGGAAALVAQWGEQFRVQGHQMDVCTIYLKGQFALDLERQGIPIYNLARRKYDFRVVLPLARLIRSGRYDAVHAHLFPTSLFVALASYLASGPRYIFSEHNVANRRRKNPVFKLLDWFIYRRFSQIISVSKVVRDSLLLWLPGLREKVCVIQNSVDPEHFSAPRSQIPYLRRQMGIAPEEFVILYAGRLAPAKGPDILLQAISLLPANFGPIKVLIAGEGPLEKTLRDQAATSSVDGRVDFLGLRKDIAHLLNLADLVVLPSRWEGLPMILLEAMAARRPVIATRVGGIPEVIQDGINGLLVDPEDPQALARTIVIALESPDLRRRLEVGARQTICTEYSVRHAVQSLFEIYSMQAPTGGATERLKG